MRRNTISAPSGLTLAFSKSRSLPMVVSSLHRHSRDSSSWCLSSLTTQSCMMASVSILSLNSSPMNLMLPMERLRALSLASSSSSCSLSRSDVCRGENTSVKAELAVVAALNVNSVAKLVPMQQSPALSAFSRTPRRPPCPSQTPSGSGSAEASGS